MGKYNYRGDRPAAKKKMKYEDNPYPKKGREEGAVQESTTASSPGKKRGGREKRNLPAWLPDHLTLGNVADDRFHP